MHPDRAGFVPRARSRSPPPHLRQDTDRRRSPVYEAYDIRRRPEDQHGARRSTPERALNDSRQQGQAPAQSYGRQQGGYGGQGGGYGGQGGGYGGQGGGYGGGRGGGQGNGDEWFESYVQPRFLLVQTAADISCTDGESSATPRASPSGRLRPKDPNGSYTPRSYSSLTPARLPSPPPRKSSKSSHKHKSSSSSRRRREATISSDSETTDSEAERERRERRKKRRSDKDEGRSSSRRDKDDRRSTREERPRSRSPDRRDRERKPRERKEKAAVVPLTKQEEEDLWIEKPSEMVVPDDGEEDIGPAPAFVPSLKPLGRNACVPLLSLVPF